MSAFHAAPGLREASAEATNLPSSTKPQPPTSGILSPTSLVLSPATEARVLQQVATGRYAAPGDLLNHASTHLNQRVD